MKYEVRNESDQEGKGVRWKEKRGNNVGKGRMGDNYSTNFAINFEL